MNFIKVKNLIVSYDITRIPAEWILEIYMSVRRKITGSWTKNKEDIVILNLLKQFSGKEIKEIKYIDIGANHYRRGNNTYLLYENGARGILVEANPLLCEKLKKHREDLIINVAIGGCGNVPFYILSMPTRSSIDEQHVKQSIKQGLFVKKVINIPCVQINDLLEQYNFEPDYLSIDIEGMDYKVLKSLNLARYKIKIIIAERDEKSEFMDMYMKKHGYEIHGYYGSNVIYKLQT